MTSTFNCPNCGAPLDYQGSDPIIRCPYCNSSVIVPENLRAKPTFSSTPSNFTLGGHGDMGGLINQARKIKQAKDLAEAGEFDKAVALYREVTGVDDFAARQAVGALASGQPITFTGMKVSDVISSVRASPPPVVQVDQKTTRKIGWALGCFVTFLVVTILISVLVPVLGTALGLFAAFSATGGDSNSPSVSIPDIEIPPGVVSVFSGFAQEELTFGGEGTGPGLFGDVRAIAVDPNTGNIYAADYDGGRVQAFDSQGKFITQWIVTGENDPYIQDMAADRSGHIFVVVFGRILAYDGQGNPAGELDVPDGGYYESIDVAADGSLVAISRGEDIVKISAEGKVTEVYPAAVSTVSGDSELSAEIAVDGLGNLYVLGTFNNSVFIFDPNGKYMNRFGSDGDQPGQFTAPGAIEVDGKGRVFVSDFNGVQAFDSGGRYIDVVKVDTYAYGLALDDQNNLYVTTNMKEVTQYSFPE